MTCFAAHQVCRTLVIGFRGYRQNGNFSNTRSQQLLKSRFTKELCKFDGRVLIHLHHANHGIPNRVGSDIPRFVGAVVILDANSASRKPRIFPLAYLPPNELGQNAIAVISLYSEGMKSASGGVSIPSVCKRKASIRSEFFKEPSSGEIPFVEQNVYR